MPPKKKPADHPTQKTIQSFFFPFTIPKKQDDEPEGDMIVVEPPNPSFFAQFTSKHLQTTSNKPKSRASSSIPVPRSVSERTTSREYSPAKARPQETTKDLSQIGSSNLDQDTASPQHASSGSIKSAQDELSKRGSAEQENQTNGAPILMGESQAREDDVEEAMLRDDGYAIQEDSPLQRAPPEASLPSLKRKREPQSPTKRAIDHAVLSTPRGSRSLSRHSRYNSVNREPSAGSQQLTAVISADSDDEAVVSPGPKHRSSAIEFGKMTASSSGKLSRSSSGLSLASHTPSLSTPAIHRFRTADTPNASSFIVRSSQEDENEDAEEIICDSEIKDELAYDSDSSLEDLDMLINKSSAVHKITTRPDTDHSNSGRFTRSQLRTSSAAKPQKSSFPSTAATPSYKFSLGTLVKQHDRDTTVQAQVAAARAAFATPDRNLLSEGFPTKTHRASTGVKPAQYQDLLSMVVNQDDKENQVEKMMHAMNRTETLHSDRGWCAFEVTGSRISDVTPFPISSLTGPLKALLQDEVMRDYVFLTGHLMEEAPMLDLPDELLSWIWTRALLEPREELSYAYLDILIHFFPGRLKDLIQPTLVKSVFENLGAVPATLDRHAHIICRQRTSSSSAEKLPTNLNQALRNLAMLSNCLSVSSKSYALDVLLRIGIDNDVAKQTDVKIALQDTIASLVEGIQETDETLLPDIRESLLDAVSEEALQQTLVALLPDFSPHLHLFRRQLALGFFFGADFNSGICWDDSSALTSAITHRLKTDSRYDVNSANVNYVKLGALITMLDAGISEGFGAPSRLTNQKTREQKQAEESFNLHVDQISGRVRTLSSRIPDSGANHMSRSEAKSAVARLLFRLENSVRTKPKAKRGIFQGAERSGFDSPAATSLLSKFLRREPKIESSGKMIEV